ncbi:MAG: hypothetical protein KIC36_01785 [Clostridium sp.]|nr:hypothetical protein [Clostridium sp.]
MVRIATVNDAEQLNILNNEFNGEGDTSIDNIRNSLMNNKQEVVIVADEDDMLVGFVCVMMNICLKLQKCMLNQHTEKEA